jgi:endonuclease/exonuclease/phosphatase family metal-dependent hydrolase
VLQWNIAGGKVHNCRTAGITAAVRRIVNERDIDFIGLNEVCPTQYDAIREELRQHWGLGPSATFSAFVGDGTPRVIGNAIFSRFPIEDVSRLPVGNDRYGARNLLCGRVVARPHLRFCSTHLTPGVSSARVQLGLVLDRIERWWENRRDTVILTGDLNLRANDSGLDRIYTEHANHPRNNPGNHGHYHELDDNDADHCRGYGERSVPSFTGGPCGDGGKIDFIFVRRSRIRERDYGADALNIPDTCGGLCSDHRPIRGHVRVRVRED